MAEDVKKVVNLEDAEVEGINPSGSPTDLDPNKINENLEDMGLPELPPEVIQEVKDAFEAVKSLDDLWRNLIYQHREKYAKYQEMQEGLGSMSFDRPETRINFTDLNAIRDELIKIEGGIETINMYRKYVLKEPEQPWLEEEMEKERAKIKVATSSKFSDPKKKKDYSKMADWEGETNKELNRLN
tara:strand:+ start:1552 stop:2106 length:555 start_codon:yes stop_codon:yes gene_type:complete